jgi:serine/threonine protein kinase/tetratricopeptide (TPR) repeat protein
MGTTPRATSDLPTEPLARSAGASGVRPGEDETTAGAEGEMRSNDPQFPTLPEAPVSPMSSNVLKAKVRAALFHKVEPVRVGRFILLERLGAGSMGEIYAAYDERLDRRVALKLVRHGSDLTVQADALLLREAQALAQVSHPNVVQIYDAGTHEGRLFIAMELIRGQTLTGWLHDAAQLPRPVRQRETLRRFIAAGRGLEAAHTAGVAHRDFKPDNVLVGEDGRVCVADFGLARVLVDDPALGLPDRTARNDEPPAAARLDFGHGATVRMDAAADRRATAAAVQDGAADEAVAVPPYTPADAPSVTPERPKLTAATRLTRTGTVMGTPRFMAPEQIRGGVADHRSDQFSFCVALYHALHGAFPFAGEHPHELLDAIETGVPGSEHSAGLAAGLRKALCRGLSVDPSERFPSMGELLAALEPGLRRRRGWIAGAVLLFLAVVAVYFWPSRQVDPCARAGDGIASAWSADRRAQVRAAFGRSDRPYADAAWHGASQRLDDYASRWRDAAVAACRLTHVDRVQSAQQLDRRMLCLERGSRQVAALVTELATGAQGAIQHAIAAVEESLPDPAACARTEDLMFGLEPPPPALAGDVKAVREQIARARALEQTGGLEDSLARARAARVAAERLEYRPVHAEALVQIARVLDARQAADARAEAQELYFAALDIAEAERHDPLAAEIWSRLVRLATWMDTGTLQAHAWWRRYEAAVHRTGSKPADQARLHFALGEIHYQEGKYAQAADEDNRAIAAIGDAPGHQLELSHYYGALALALQAQDSVDEAIRLHERALDIATKALGPSHPDVIALQLNYGLTLKKQRRFDLARAVLAAALASMPAGDRESSLDAGRAHSYLSAVSYEQDHLNDAVAHARTSLQIYERAGAPDARRAEAAASLAGIEIKRHNFPQALAMFEQALGLRRGLGPDHPQVAVNHGSIAEALAGLGRYGDAMSHVREAERVLLHAPGEAFRAWILTVHGEVLVGQHQLAAAVPVLEDALARFDRIPDPDNQAVAMWAQARALHGLGKNPARALELAERARQRFAALGDTRTRDAVTDFIARASPVPSQVSAPPTP